MTIHEFGTENTELILLIHPSVVKWDYFENVIPLLEKKYHLLVPALPGYDFDNDSDFTSVEQIASDLNVWMKAQGYTELYAVYGSLHGWFRCTAGCAGTTDQNKTLCHGWWHHPLSTAMDRDALHCPEGLSYDDDRKNRRCRAFGKSICNR